MTDDVISLAERRALKAIGVDEEHMPAHLACPLCGFNLFRIFVRADRVVGKCSVKGCEGLVEVRLIR